MPKDQFETTEEDLKEQKMDRLIDEVVLRHFLRKEHILIPDKTIDADIAELKKNPPSAGCMCCRYKSLQQYMDMNAYTMDELRAEIRNNEGFNQYLRLQWEKAYPTQAARLAYARQAATAYREIVRKAVANLLQHLSAGEIRQRPERRGESKKGQSGHSLAAIATW